VTDLYQTEANAHLINVPGYITHLFEDGPHIHKDDVETYPFDRINNAADDVHAGATVNPVLILIRRRRRRLAGREGVLGGSTRARTMATVSSGTPVGQDTARP
jgi:hypothetical protein